MVLMTTAFKLESVKGYLKGLFTDLYGSEHKHVCRKMAILRCNRYLIFNLKTFKYKLGITPLDVSNGLYYKRFTLIIYDGGYSGLHYKCVTNVIFASS